MKQWKTLQTSSVAVHYSTLSSINKVSAWPNRMNRYFIANGYLYFISNPCVSICLISWPMITTTGSLKTRETLVVSKLTTSHQLKISHPNWNMNSDYTPPRIKISNYTTIIARQHCCSSPISFCALNCHIELPSFVLPTCLPVKQQRRMQKVKWWRSFKLIGKHLLFTCFWEQRHIV